MVKVSERELTFSQQGQSPGKIKQISMLMYEDVQLPFTIHVQWVLKNAGFVKCGTVFN